MCIRDRVYVGQGKHPAPWIGQLLTLRDRRLAAVSYTHLDVYKRQPQGKPNDEPYLASVDEDGVEFDVSLTESTFLGQSMPEPSSFDMTSINLDLKEPEIEIPESVPSALVEAGTLPDSSYESVQVSTAVNEDFAMQQAETLIAPRSVDTPDISYESVQVSTAVNPDFASEQAETLISPRVVVEPDMLPEQDLSLIHI